MLSTRKDKGLALPQRGWRGPINRLFNRGSGKPREAPPGRQAERGRPCVLPSSFPPQSKVDTEIYLQGR